MCQVNQTKTIFFTFTCLQKVDFRFWGWCVGSAENQILQMPIQHWLRPQFKEVTVGSSDRGNWRRLFLTDEKVRGIGVDNAQATCPFPPWCPRTFKRLWRRWWSDRDFWLLNSIIQHLNNRLILVVIQWRISKDKITEFTQPTIKNYKTHRNSF